VSVLMGVWDFGILRFWDFEILGVWEFGSSGLCFIKNWLSIHCICLSLCVRFVNHNQRFLIGNRSQILAKKQQIKYVLLT